MKATRLPYSHNARLSPVAKQRRAYGVTYVRTLNGQIWREENLKAAQAALLP